MIHRKANRFSEEEEIEDLKQVEDAKVLGYQFNRNNNCSTHLNKIDNKIKKVHRMIFLTGKNELDKWKRLYVFMQYTMSLFYYGSH